MNEIDEAYLNQLRSILPLISYAESILRGSSEVSDWAVDPKEETRCQEQIANFRHMLSEQILGEFSAKAQKIIVDAEAKLNINLAKILEKNLSMRLLTLSVETTPTLRWNPFVSRELDQPLKGYQKALLTVLDIQDPKQIDERYTEILAQLSILTRNTHLLNTLERVYKNYQQALLIQPLLAKVALDGGRQALVLRDLFSQKAFPTKRCDIEKEVIQVLQSLQQEIPCQSDPSLRSS